MRLRATRCDTARMQSTTPRVRDLLQSASAVIERVDADSCQINFAEPQWAVTPGQSVVVYESRVCLGGGIIL